jgi:hypothetical protein
MSHFITRLSVVIAALIPLSILGQTTGELHQKYPVSSRIETFDIRPGIIAIVTYGSDGNTTSVTLTPPITFSENGALADLMPLKAVDDVIAELVPEEKRGDVCEDDGLSIIGNQAFRRISYENVGISTVTVGNKVASAYIEWRQCDGKLAQ